MHIIKHYALSNVFVIKNLVRTNVHAYVTFVNNIVFNHSKMIIELKDFASFFEQFWEKKKKKICFVFLYFFFYKKNITNWILYLDAIQFNSFWSFFLKKNSFFTRNIKTSKA